MRRWSVLVVLVAVGTAGCSSSTGSRASSSARSTPPSSASSIAATPAGVALPLGDGHVSSSPRRGYVDVCGPGRRPWCARCHGIGAVDSRGPVVSLAEAPRLGQRRVAEGAFQRDSAWSEPGAVVGPRAGARHDGNVPDHPRPTRRTGTTPTRTRSCRRSSPFRSPRTRLRPGRLPACTPGASASRSTGCCCSTRWTRGGRDAVAHEVTDHCGGHPRRARDLPLPRDLLPA